MAVDPTPYYQDVATGLSSFETNGSDPTDASPTSRTRLSLVPFQDIRPSGDPPYLIKGLVPREGLTVVWGEPKCGKSFLIFDAGMAVALPKDYRGRRVQAGPVVYVAAEGAIGLRARVEAYRRHHGIDPEAAVPFYLMPDALDLIDDVDGLIGSIRQTLGETRPALVVLDTLNRSLAGSENDPADMGAYIKAVDHIRESFACAVLVIHHCGTEARRPRGHTSLTGAADAQLAITRTPDGSITCTVEWMKDGPEGDEIHSRLEVVEVGTDDDGDPITSCVVVPADAPATPEPRRKLGKNEQTMLDLLAEHMPTGLMKDEWSELGRQEGIGLRRRADLNDCRRSLKHKGMVHEHADRWFITSR